MLTNRLFTLHLINHPKRHALKRKNLNYFLWRYLANGRRAARAIVARDEFPDSRFFAAALRDDGLAQGPSDRFLSPEGRDALAEVSRAILTKSQSANIRSAVGDGRSMREGEKKKDTFLIELVAPEDVHDANDAIVRLALDRKLLEIAASYLGLWPELHAIYAWLNFPNSGGPQALPALAPRP